MNEDRMMRAISAVLAVPCLLLMVFSSLAFSAESPLVQELKYYYFTEKGDKVEITMATDSIAERVAVDNQGNAYLTDSNMQTVEVFNSNARHIRKFTSVHVPVGIAVSGDGENKTVYVGGYLNGNIVALLNQNGGVKGFLGLGAIRGAFNDIALNANNDLYVMDQQSDNTVKIKKLNPDGAVIKEFGPYSERKDIEIINGIPYNWTIHKMTSPAGIAVDESKGELYVSIREVVAKLNNSKIGYPDINESYNYYKDSSGNTLSPDYNYWQTLFDRQRVIVIDLNTGALKDRLIDLFGGFVDTGSTASTAVPVFGLAVDNKDRVYVATYSGIKVFDLISGVPLSVSGGFVSGMHKGLAFVPDIAGGGLLYATSGNRVIVYGIDRAVPLTNSAPSAPAPIAPASGTYATSRTPDFEVRNAIDANMDPLSYGYEIYEVSNNAPVLLASAAGIADGTNGKTSMASTTTLNENTRYRWRAQSFDGNAATWSDFSEFCVNENNNDPSIPELIGPKDMATVSPFSSSLTWNPSTDLDCYDTVSYIVQVSEDPGFETILASFNEHTTSLRIDKLGSLLRKGGSYYWRVKGVDDHSGESAFSSGSFVYSNTVVIFTSDQPETTVYIDGNYGYSGRALGRAPVSVEGITPGPHFVTFIKGGHYDGKGNYKPGYEPYHTIVNVADPVADTSTEVSAEMKLAGKIVPSSAGDELINLESGMSSPFVVDYNNDGLKDIIVGSKDGKVYLYLAEEQIQPDGTKKVVLTSKGTLQADEVDINLSSMTVPFVADYNNDGKKDLLVGSGDGLIYLYLNTGQEEVPVFAASGNLKDLKGNGITVGANAAPAVVDYNNDGKKDIVVGSYDGTLKAYLNVGSDEAPEFDSSSTVAVSVDGNFLDVGSNSKAFFTDWNSDGKKDLVVGRGVPDLEGNTLNLFLNVGTDSDPIFVSIPALRKWTAGKRKERGNKEYVPYLGFNKDLGDLTGGGNAAPFVVDWTGSFTRDVIVGRGDGRVFTFISK